MTHTGGIAGDSPELISHIEALKKMNADLEIYSADGGYDSFLNHSDIWYHLNAKPIISYASNAVINQEGEEERINDWVNQIASGHPTLKGGVCFGPPARFFGTQKSSSLNCPDFLKLCNLNSAFGFP